MLMYLFITCHEYFMMNPITRIGKIVRLYYRRICGTHSLDLEQKTILFQPMHGRHSLLENLFYTRDLNSFIISGISQLLYSYLFKYDH